MAGFTDVTVFRELIRPQGHLTPYVVEHLRHVDYRLVFLQGVEQWEVNTE